jgi:hypothetical protein
MRTLQAKFNPEEVSPTIGYLFYKDSDTRWIAHEFTEVKGRIHPGSIAFLFDPEGNGDPVRGSEVWRSPTLSRRKGFPRIPVLVNIDDNLHVNTTVDPENVLCGVMEQVGLNEETARNVHAPAWFAARGAAIVDPFWETACAFMDNRLNELVAIKVKEQAGVIRWLMTMFAAMNALPRDVRQAKTREGCRMVGMHQLHYLGHSNLTLTLPRDDRVRWARKHLDRNALGARRAWHRVIGHWRVVEPGKSQGGCRHMPVMVESGLGVCERCELLVRWIEVPNGRGDPTLGIVEHTYRVVGRKKLNSIKLEEIAS